MSAAAIQAMVLEAFPDATVTLADLAGDDDHFALTVLSERFRGLSRVRQHRLVYEALQGHMGAALHALALKTGLPASTLS
jgi:stress-induced morphogen